MFPLDLLPFRVPRFEIEPEPDLPRRYTFWRDVGFWTAIAWLLWVAYLLWLVIRSFSPQGSDGWVFVCVAVVVLSHPTVIFWMLWDSWRWHLPHRGEIVLFSALTLHLWFFWYFMFRNGWVMEAKRARRLHQLAAGGTARGEPR